MDKWDQLYFDLCKRVAQQSKDPSTKVGAFIVRPNRTPVSFGYNGFPRGVEDAPLLYEDREEKYPRVVHAEVNAILNAGSPVRDCTLYVWPLVCCPTCAGVIIQSGIREVKVLTNNEKVSWNIDQTKISVKMFDQANILFKIFKQ